jgi:hypothetical protein
MTNVIIDPVNVVMRGKQKLYSDPTYAKTKMSYEVTEKQSRTDLYNIQTLKVTLPSYVAMDSLVLAIPIQLDVYMSGNYDPATAPFDRWLWADMSVLNALYEVTIKLSNQQIDTESQAKIRNLKTIITDCKFDEDDYDYLGLWGLPYSQTVAPANPEQETMAIKNTPLRWYRAFESLLRSTSVDYNGTAIKNFITSQPQGYMNVDKHTIQTSLPLPLKYISKGLRAQGRLTPGMVITIEIKSHSKPQLMGAYPQAADTIAGTNIQYATTYALTSTGGIKLYYLYDYLNPAPDEIIKNYRLSESLTFPTDLMEEFIFPGGEGQILLQPITTQQQLPNEIIIKTIATETFTDGVYMEGGAFSELDNSTFKPLMIPGYYACFRDSLSILKRKNVVKQSIPYTFMKRFELFSSGEQILYDYNDSTISEPAGSFYGSAQDYIYNMLMNKNSHLSVTRYRTLNKPLKNFNSVYVNAPLSIIFLPGQITDQGMQSNDPNAKMIKIGVQYEVPIDDRIELVVYRKIPAIWEIQVNNDVTLRRWPMIGDNNIVKIITPYVSA